MRWSCGRISRYSGSRAQRGQHEGMRVLSSASSVSEAMGNKTSVDYSEDVGCDAHASAPGEITPRGCRGGKPHSGNEAESNTPHHEFTTARPHVTEQYLGADVGYEKTRVSARLRSTTSRLRLRLRACLPTRDTRAELVLDAQLGSTACTPDLR